MPAVATAIGSASSSTPVAEVTLDTTPDPDAVIHIMSLILTGPGAFQDTRFFHGGSDTIGGTWEVEDGFATIGNTNTIWGTNPNVRALNVCSSVRSAGSPLSAGDKVSATWHTGAYAQETLGLVVAVTGVTVTRAADDQGTYFNGDSYPDGSSSSSALNWEDDWGIGAVPTPDAASTFLTAIGASPGTTGWTPVIGAIVEEVSITNLSLAVTFAASRSTITEPGGTFASGRSGICGNYMFEELAAAAPAGVRILEVFGLN